MGIHTVFFYPDLWNYNEWTKSYGIEIYVDDDPLLESSPVLAYNVAEGGYFPLTSVTTGRYMSVRRPGCPHPDYEVDEWTVCDEWANF